MIRRHHDSPTRFYWLVPGALLAHCAEPLPRFPRWATEHFGTTTTRFYVASHCALVPLVLASGARGAGQPGSRRAAFFATSVATALGLNAVFHVATTALFRRYSPGLVIAASALLPASAYTLYRARRDGLLSGRAAGWRLPRRDRAGERRDRQPLRRHAQPRRERVERPG